MESFSPSLFVLSIAATSFVTFQCLFHFVSPWISAQFFPGYHRLSPRHTIEWNSRTVSTLHALIVGLFCLYILFHDDAVNEDPVWGDPSLVKINVAITCGYLLSDMLLICYFWRAIGDKFFVIHHLAALYANYYVLSIGMLPYFANFRLVAELSTPCVNQRWFFEVLGYPKRSLPNMVNGIAMTASFFLVRIAVMPLYYSRMYAVYGTEPFYRVTFGGRCAWMGPSFCLDIMNVMWMHKMARGCIGVLRSPGKVNVEKLQNGKVH